MKTIKFCFFLIFAFSALQCISQQTEDFIDNRDGRTYKIVKLGDLWWMAENLNYCTSEGSAYYKNDSISYASKYGRLYNWETANKSCPQGWHLSSHDDWKNLEQFLGISSNEYQNEGHYYIGTVEGGKLKSSELWNEPNTGASNSTGFSAIPAGLRHADNAPEPWKHNFYDLGEVAHFWASEYSEEEAYVRIFSNKESRIHIIDSHKSAYRSVRCVKTISTGSN